MSIQHSLRLLLLHVSSYLSRFLQQKVSSYPADFFKYAVINWNSGNFYTVYASNSKNNLLSFLSNMTPALTPNQFVHTDLPVALLNLNKNEIKYRVIKEK